MFQRHEFAAGATSTARASNVARMSSSGCVASNRPARCVSATHSTSYVPSTRARLTAAARSLAAWPEPPAHRIRHVRSIGNSARDQRDTQLFGLGRAAQLRDEFERELD